ncbi:MAG: single-stranded DNA-binding protein [Corynebacteriales bacterium]|nr:single-stranded DNA-binding protein [Mycobacteriales bacterium]
MSETTPAATSTVDSEEDQTELLISEGDLAADYLERLLDITDTDGDIDMDVRDGRAVVAIVGDHLKAFIGPRGATLDALQDLTRLAVAQQTGTRSRLMLDIGGHRAQRKEELIDLAQRTAEEVIASGETARLAPMNAFERKIVHDAISGYDELETESEGEDPGRRVVIFLRNA